MKNNDIVDLDRLQFGRNEIRYLQSTMYANRPIGSESNYGFYFEDDGTVRYWCIPETLQISEEKFYNTFFFKRGFFLGEYNTTCNDLFYCQEGKKCQCGYVKEWIRK